MPQKRNLTYSYVGGLADMRTNRGENGYIFCAASCFFFVLCDKIKKRQGGVMDMMSMVTGLIVCAFVYIIREMLMSSGDDEIEN